MAQKPPIRLPIGLSGGIESLLSRCDELRRTARSHEDTVQLMLEEFMVANQLDPREYIFDRDSRILRPSQAANADEKED